METTSNEQQPTCNDAMAPKPTLEVLAKKATEEKYNMQPVRLPEWGGFWFRAGKEILVFTKDREILNTPDYEQFGERKDYVGIDFTAEQDVFLPQDFIKACRLRLDEILQIINTQLPKNRETASAATATQLAFMWCGKILSELGAANPYPKSFDAKSPDIEKHADKKEDSKSMLIEDLTDLTETALVKTLRVELNRTADMIRAFYQWNLKRHYPADNSYPPGMATDKSLQEATMWLGQQLNNIRLAEESK